MFKIDSLIYHNYKDRPDVKLELVIDLLDKINDYITVYQREVYDKIIYSEMGHYANKLNKEKTIKIAKQFNLSVIDSSYKLEIQTKGAVGNQIQELNNLILCIICLISLSEET